MNKKIITLGILSIFILTTLSSVNAKEANIENNFKNLNKYGYSDIDRLAKSEGYVPPLNPNDDYTTRGEIWIRGNNEFTIGNGVTGGSGSENDPYVIEGWETPRIVILSTTAYFIIKNCRVYGERGLMLDDVQNGLVRHTQLSHESDSGGWGLQVFGSYNNVFEHVTVDRYVWSFIVDESHNNNFDHCQSFDSTWAFIIDQDSYNNMVKYSNLTNSVSGFCVDGYDNIIHHNNIRKIDGFYATSIGGKKNQWDDGIGHGNYWQNYHGTDLNKDGIGDIPYIINLKNIDHYPKINPYGKVKTKVYTNGPLEQFLENHPYIFPILRLLLRL